MAAQTHAVRCLFCQLRKWPPARMPGRVYRPVRPLVLIYNSMAKTNNIILPPSWSCSLYPVTLTYANILQKRNQPSRKTLGSKLQVINFLFSKRKMWSLYIFFFFFFGNQHWSISINALRIDCLTQHHCHQAGFGSVCWVFKKLHIRGRSPRSDLMSTENKVADHFHLFTKPMHWTDTLDAWTFLYLL